MPRAGLPPGTCGVTIPGMASATRVLLALIAALVVVMAAGIFEARRLFRYQAIDATHAVVFDRVRGVFCSPQGCTAPSDLPMMRYSLWRASLGTDSVFPRIADCVRAGNPYRDSSDAVCPPGIIRAGGR
jgi:hypothetical protein